MYINHEITNTKLSHINMTITDACGPVLTKGI